MANGPGSTYRGGRQWRYHGRGCGGARGSEQQRDSAAHNKGPVFCSPVLPQSFKLIHSLFLFFFQKNKPSYAVMRTRNTTTRATPSELRDYAVTLHTHTHACTHTRARLHACAHTHTRVARNRVIV